jgi:hypothetical protein
VNVEPRLTMSQDARPTIPKFSSFKPELPARQLEARDDQVDDSSKQRESHRSKSRGHRDKSHKELPIHESIVNQDEFEESDVFIVDRRGDRKNIEFGRLHRYSVPAYQRTGAGKVIGAGSSERIDRVESTDGAIVMSSLQSEGRKSARPLLEVRDLEKSLRLLKPTGSIYVKTTSSEQGTGHGMRSRAEQDYIELSHSRSLKRKRDSDTPDVDYRSIEGKAKTETGPADEDVEEVTDFDEADETRSMEIQQKIAELTRKTKEHPADAQAWLKLGDFQSEVVSPGLHTIPLSVAEKRTVAELRIAIYERATKHIAPGSAGHDCLRLRLLEEGSHIWETSKLAQSWEDALNHNQHSILLWAHYFTFLQASPAFFTFSKCKAAYIRCLHALHDTTETHEASSDARLYVFLRLTCYIRDAGYSELAYALWQVVIEYHFLRPPAMPNDHESTLAALEDWWESEVPRVGEEGAQGWQSFVAGHSDRSRRRCQSSQYKTGDGSGSLLESIREEALLVSKLHLPADSSDEDTDDPFCFVMFSDMKDIVTHMLDQRTDQCLDAFLCFVGLPMVHYQRGDVMKKVPGDPFLHTHWIRDQKSLNNQQRTPFDLFHSNFFPRLDEDTSLFVDRLLASLADSSPQLNELAEYYLAFKLHVRPSEVVKVAKKLLKARSTSLHLYNAYALIEAKLGNLERAIATWQTASGGDFGQSEEQKLLLWHSWALSLIDGNMDDEAIAVLAGIATGKVLARDPHGLSSSQHLRAVQHLQEGVDSMLEAEQLDLAVLYADCISWLMYLTDTHSLDAAMPRMAGLESKIASSKASGTACVALELLHQCKARMFDWHIQRRRPYKPQEVRHMLQKSLQLFPENSLLLGVLSRIRGHTKVEDRLRETTKTAMKTYSSPGLVATHHKLLDEIERHHNETVTSQSVRNMFMSSLITTDGDLKHSPLLWSLWLNFELSLECTQSMQHQNRTQIASRAAKVLHEGMLCLPWQKEWAVTSMSAFLDVGPFEDLSAVLDVMAERETRFRVERLSSA